MARKKQGGYIERERCEDFFDSKFCSVAAIAGVATVAGAAMTSSATSSAAEGQQQATQQANALQYQMHQDNIALQRPAIDAGNTARNQLMYRLGLGTTPGTGGGTTKPTLTYDQLRAQLVGKYTKNGAGAGASAQLSPQNQSQFDRYAAGTKDPAALAAFRNGLLEQQGGAIGYTRNGAGGAANGGENASENTVYGYGPQSASQIDETGLDAEIRRMLAEQDAAAEAQRQQAMQDPMYGDLADKYVAGTYTPETFKFGLSDFQADPGYQFRLEQGQKALDRKAAAGGRFFSGSALTGAADFAGGLASQEFGNAFSRAMNTFGTNEGNRRGAFALNEGNRFGAFQANFNNAVNPLLSLAGAATLGSQNLGSAGAQVASAVGANLTNNANAQGAAGIAGANSISSGINGAVGNYQNNQLMQQLLNNRSGNVNSNPYPSGANYAGDNPGYQG